MKLCKLKIGRRFAQSKLVFWFLVLIINPEEQHICICVLDFN